MFPTLLPPLVLLQVADVVPLEQPEYVGWVVCGNVSISALIDCRLGLSRESRSQASPAPCLSHTI